MCLCSYCNWHWEHYKAAYDDDDDDDDDDSKMDIRLVSVCVRMLERI